MIEFERIYDTDLRYSQDCWKLCGDAHCCSFSRYKSKFNLIGKSPFQELPLLPGEYEFLKRKGWLAQFQQFEHKVIEYPLDHRVIRVESIVSVRPDCACDQATRTTICRLYPVLPILDVSGKFVGVDRCGIYEELEELGKLSPACKIEAVPIRQMDMLLSIVNAIGRSPTGVFHLMAYRMAKSHVVASLTRSGKNSDRNVFSQFETALLKRQLFNHHVLRQKLIDLADAFGVHYGDRFALPGTTRSATQHKIEINLRGITRRIAIQPINFPERRVADRRAPSAASVS